ncbi:MAG: FUN14 domain-containing protein, partial [Candidatus Nitrosopolaris sp.]
MELGIAATSLGGGFFGGIVIGYALKKVAKVVAIVFGLFLAGLAYLQYQGIASMNWNKLQNLSQGAANG